jgi:hypothetical protein
MLLVLEDVPGINADQLMTRVSKVTALVGVRGPLIDARCDRSGFPLATLDDGQKLHIVAGSNGKEVAGEGPGNFVTLLAALGLPKAARLKQIHLIAPWAGCDTEQSFAARFERELARRGILVDEVKAPLGPIHSDAHGKIWVYSEAEKQWMPSSPKLNYYVGPRVASKHLPQSCHVQSYPA